MLGSWPVAAGLLAAFWAMAFTSLLEKSPAFDEPVHLTAGYSFWTTGDWRLDPENGVLPQRLMALPLLLGDWRFPSLDQRVWRLSDEFTLAHQFLYKTGNDPDAMMRLAHAAMATVAAAGGLGVWLISRRIFGPLGGIVSLAAYAFNPGFLANGPLATSDATAAVIFLPAVWCFWQLLQKVTWARLGLSCLAAGLLVVSKFNGLLLAPVALGLIALRLAVRRPMPVRVFRSADIRRRLPRAALLAGLCAAHLLAAAAIIWAFHGFRFSPFKNPMPGEQLIETWPQVLKDSGRVGGAIAFARDCRLLPESYLFGLAYVLEHSRHRLAFLNGQVGVYGWPTFFPYAFLVKTPIPLLVLLVMAAAAAILKWRSADADSSPRWAGRAWQAFYLTAPLWVLMAVYWASSLTAKINIGHRHLLPVYPPLFVLAGAAGWWLRKGAGAAIRTVAAVVLAALAAEPLLAWPNYLAYFNQFAGGTPNGYKHLVDSSLDWGQDLPGLKRWLQQRGLTGENPPVYFSYFGAADPAWYEIPGQLPSYFDRRADPRLLVLRGGYYCLSASILQTTASGPMGPWNEQYENTYRQSLRLISQYMRDAGDPVARARLPQASNAEYWNKTFTEFDYYRLARLCAYLRRYRGGPIDNIGGSILIFRLSDQEVQQALYGPPAEMLSRLIVDPQ